MASEAEVEAGAEVIAASLGIDAPKLSAPCWMGLSRAVLEAAERVREGLSKSRARRLGHFVMTGDDVLIREDRPE